MRSLLRSFGTHAFGQARFRGLHLTDKIECCFQNRFIKNCNIVE